ncbi:MAG: hypothetical protein ACK6D3_18375 [Planctomycetaceae bacterium]|jgi:hypothetical protein
MSSVSPRSTLSVVPLSATCRVADPRLEKPLTAPPVTADPASAGNASQRPARQRRRTQRGLARPRCPRHGGEMLVGRTVGSVQYRYCTVTGCNCAVTTFRSDAPHKRWPPASHSGGPRREREPRNDGTGPPGGGAVDGVTIIPQESPVVPAAWPVGRPVPGQSS